jgi:chromosome segregation ATPase
VSEHIGASATQTMTPGALQQEVDLLREEARRWTLRCEAADSACADLGNHIQAYGESICSNVILRCDQNISEIHSSSFSEPRTATDVARAHVLREPEETAPMLKSDYAGLDVQARPQEAVWRERMEGMIKEIEGTRAQVGALMEGMREREQTCGSEKEPHSEHTAQEQEKDASLERQRERVEELMKELDRERKKTRESEGECARLRALCQAFQQENSDMRAEVCAWDEACKLMTKEGDALKREIALLKRGQRAKMQAAFENLQERFEKVLSERDHFDALVEEAFPLAMKSLRGN